MPVAYGGQPQQRWGDHTLNTGEFMRDLFLSDLKGTMQATGAARKKGMLLLAFFKTDDPACQKALPFLETLAGAYKETGKLTVWGVSQDDEATTSAFATQFGITFPLLLDRDKYHSMLYGLVTLPTLYLADSAGAVQRKMTGWNGAILNDISARIAKFANVEEPIVFVAPDGVTALPVTPDPAPPK